jgi:hypothetical protein
MIHITYYPSTNDTLSSGHILWEIFTVYIFSMLIPIIKPVWNNKWNLSDLISENSFKKYTDTPLKTYDYTINIDNHIKWESLDYNDFLDIKKKIYDNYNNYNNILIVLSNVCKIHIDRLCVWYKLKYINTDIYNIYAIPTLKKLYYYDHNNSPLESIAIHIRNGDLTKLSIDNGYTFNYYKNIINILRLKYNNIINIYCEDVNINNTTTIFSKDKSLCKNFLNEILELNNIENVYVKLGNKQNINEQFNELCRSKILIVSPSSLSLFAAFISNGIILIDENHAKCRPNLFKYLNNVSNFTIFNSKNLYNIL